MEEAQSETIDRREQILREVLKVDKAAGLGKMMWFLHRAKLLEAMSLYAMEEQGWIKYDISDPESRPKKYGKYFVCRKDRKVHWETWNGSGWAYNHKSITHFKEVKLP